LLPGLISTPADQTAEFRRTLVIIASFRPSLSGLLDVFDGSGPYWFAGPRPAATARRKIETDRNEDDRK
jgi:hypothetical protein